MRYILYEVQEDWIPLSTELEYIKKYIDLQKIRTNNDEFVSLQINGPTDGMIEGMRDYRRICLKNEKIMTLETFGQLERQLPAANFCRVHKSYLVALDKIEAIERDRITIQKAIIPVSVTYREIFYQLIGRPEKLG